ncbi:MAG: hypothetical protein N2323_01095 [candidate division WOR-3 bacterium]|nr:hypothetical protein [candidate division WOR-3 bacterium]MCX7836542.1 hypothetical protein [candidate division WOR-3 bacterium]MDW8113887.1 hypothetical protein [candidate division WOR-3 bacterium]
MAERPYEELIIHDKLIACLKQTVYRYPNEKYPYLKTYTNHPDKQKGIYTINGEYHYPDIVVIDLRNERVIMIAEVETISTLNEIEAEEWKNFSTLSLHFALFYPKGYEFKIRQLCKNIKIDSFLEYHEDEGKFKLEKKRIIF